MKKTLVLLMALMLLLTGCGRANVENAEYVVGESAVYSETDITTAMDRAKAFFKAEFEGCSLIELSYEEDAAANEEWADSYGYEEAIVLSSVFSVDEEGSSTNLEPDTYEHFSWVLGRNAKGPWQLLTLGFA